MRKALLDPHPRYNPRFPLKPQCHTIPQAMSIACSFSILAIIQLNELGENLSGEVSRRLLIPGVITQNILNQYINMLKVLQLLDPQGMVF
jgi:hypothetical protein